MPGRKPTRREIGRGERVLPGVWRLRLPLPWPGVPHCNAYAVASGDGIVLVDTGMHEPGSLGHLERALDQVNLRLEHVHTIVCTHAHSDHCGEVGTIVARSRRDVRVLMHPQREHLDAYLTDPEGVMTRRLEVAAQSGVPEAPLKAWAERRRSSGSGVAPLPDGIEDLVPGVEVETDLGRWGVIETPGHAPSHVCLHQPERRLLFSGDHLLGRVSLYFEMGFSPDPVGEFLLGLERVEALDARLALSGHGRPFTDVVAHIEANRALVRQRLHAVKATLGADGGCHAFALAQRVYGPAFGEESATWLLSKTLAYLTHLERLGEVVREPDGTHEIWNVVPGEGAGPPQP